MANDKKKQGSGGVRKYGRNTAKCADYKAHGIRKENKLKKIAQSNGRFAHKHYRLGGQGNCFPDGGGLSPYLVYKGCAAEHWAP